MSLLNISVALEELASTSVRWEPRLCSRTHFPRSRCDDCVQACPEGILSWDQTLRREEGKCTGCGLCIAACPNGAFWDRNGGDTALVRDMGYLIAQSQSKVFKFACSRCDLTAEATPHLCCLSRLTESIILAPLLNGAIRVEIYRPDCRGCMYERSLSHLEGTIRLSKGLARMTGFKSDSIVECEVHLRCEPLSGISSPATARRDFLRQAGQVALRAAAAFLPETGETDEGKPPAHAVSPKRAFLLGLIQCCAKQQPVSVNAEGIRVAEIKINNDCTGCPVCSTLCPAGALERVESEDAVSLYFRPWLCTGCLICREACLFQAVSLSAEFPLESLRDRNSQLLCRLTHRICQDCGESFWGVDSHLCGHCRMSRQMAHPDLHKDFPRGREQT